MQYYEIYRHKAKPKEVSKLERKKTKPSAEDTQNTHNIWYLTLSEVSLRL